jgi:hypothetical protein
MTGRRLACTDRDRNLLSEVARLGLVTREHLVRLGFFSSKTRANERLKRLVAEGLLVSRVQPLVAGGPRLVYAVGPALEASRARRRKLQETSPLFLDHELGLVDIRLAFERHTHVMRWLTAADLADHRLGLLPDAFVEYEAETLRYAAFIEYDRGTESQGRIERKVRGYLDLALSGRFERTFHRRFFRALFVTDSDRRLREIAATTARISDKVIRLATKASLEAAAGPLAPIWLKPGQDDCQSLTQP